MKSPSGFKWTRAFNALSPIKVKLLGKKGAGIAEMIKLGLPVPPGFTLTTKSWHSFKKGGQISSLIWQEILDQIKILEKKTAKNFADSRNPLIVSVRSGAAYSIPGMMDTIINVGINDKTLTGLVNQVGQVSAKDSYQHLKQNFKKLTGQALPQDPFEQLKKAVREVLKSWDRPEVFIYRQNWGLPHNAGTAVSIQAMVFGNIPQTYSGTGVIFTRDPRTGEKKRGSNLSLILKALVWLEASRYRQAFLISKNLEASLKIIALFLKNIFKSLKTLNLRSKKTSCFYSKPGV